MLNITFRLSTKNLYIYNRYLSICLNAKEQLAKMIAGEVVLSDDPGQTLRKWREIFGVTQTDLAHQLSISPSVVSDYEGGRQNLQDPRQLEKLLNVY